MSIHFFTAADQRYEEYVIPFLFSVLASNPDSTAEICLGYPADFLEAEPAGMSFLESNFSGRFVVRSFNQHYYGSTLPKKAATFRFLELPTMKSDIIYISDIDILYTCKDIYRYEMRNLQRHEYCFNNILRPSMNRFTGSFGAKSEEYYTLLEPIIQQFFQNPEPFLVEGSGDEHILFCLLNKAMATPKVPASGAEHHLIRKIHGIHSSPNRKINGKPGWGVTDERIREYKQLKLHPLWDEWESLLTPNYRMKILRPLESFIADH